MPKKILVGAAAVIVAVIGFFAIGHNTFTDYLNPFIPETISYAKVPKNTQKYYQVDAVNAQTGKKLPYKIQYVGGYDPTRQYIKIHHKGQYARIIDYISKQKFANAGK